MYPRKPSYFPIHAPRTCAGRPGYVRSVQYVRSVSIRAPHTRAGRRHAAGPQRAHEGVSIRAPRTRAGRQVIRDLHDTKKIVSIRAPRTRAGRLRPSLSVEPQALFSPFSPTCQSLSHADVPICQRTMENARHHCGCPLPRNPGCRPVTSGSRNGVHTINGSFRSTASPPDGQPATDGIPPSNPAPAPDGSGGRRGETRQTDRGRCWSKPRCNHAAPARIETKADN